MYSRLALSLRTIFFLFFFGELCLMVFFSYTIGRIDDTIKMSTDLIYKRYIVTPRRILRDVYSQNKFDFFMYFLNCWKPGTLGLSVMGFAINSETSIKLITVFLTIFAIISNSMRN